MQDTAPNSTMGGDDYDYGADSGKLNAQLMPNTRAKEYISTEYAGPGQEKRKPKMTPKNRESQEYGGWGV